MKGGWSVSGRPLFFDGTRKNAIFIGNKETVMKKLITILALLFSAALLQAQNLRVAHIFSDHMVMQRDTQAPVWGWGEPGKTVTVLPSWSGVPVTAKVAKDGTWRVNVETGNAGGPYFLTVKSGKDEIMFKDILLGEVWICAGQSNMEMPIGGFGFQIVEGAREAAIKAATYADKVRIIDIKTPRCTEPIDDVDASWKRASARSCVGTSAIGWFFAAGLADNLDVPVGIIVNPWGGSRIESWMTRESIDAAGITAEERAAIDAVVEDYSKWPETPELIWNGRMAPIAGYAAKGFLWYQGCSNVGRAVQYESLFQALILDWQARFNKNSQVDPFPKPEPQDNRRRWMQNTESKALPFYFVQLANYLQRKDLQPQSGWAALREVQRKAQKLDGVGMMVNIDIGMVNDIHPKNKQEVGRRLALLALNRTYGREEACSAPEYLQMNVSDGKALLSFMPGFGNDMLAENSAITGFTVAGPDHQWHVAKAHTEGNGQFIWRVVVECPEVPHPVAVRYAWADNPECNLKTVSGLPVGPFRTDDWDDIK